MSGGDERRLYLVNVTDEVDGRRGITVAASSRNEPASMARWHRRLAHFNVRALQSLAASGLVEGMEVTGKKVEGRCVDCILGKAHKHPFDDIVIPEKEVLERVHLDLFGKARVASHGGANYMMLCAD
ncbi:hypothetical protein CYLTODRAFT_363489, partial [Cylindrobasidium torrendii FP15055 ss-10]